MPNNKEVSSLRSSMASVKLDTPSPSAKRDKWGSRLGARENDPKSSQAKVSSVQGDGWQTVEYSKTVTEKPWVRNTNPDRHSPPSHAAQSRRGIYEPQTRPKSLYKQAMLPPEDRDPALVEIEANKGKRYKKSEFRPGMIIRGVVHEQDYIATSTGSNLTITDRNRTDSRYGPICTKYRKMIVLALFEDHYLAIPLFTHNGKGLANKTRPDEFVSIKDHRFQGQVPPQSCHPPLETEVVNNGIDLFDVKSTAHITYGLSRNYDLPVIMEGLLTKRSLNRLVHLFKLYAPEQLRETNGKVLM